jgi:hypothetical protein
MTGSDGQCGAWAAFMRDVLKVHGLNARLAAVVPDATSQGLPAGVTAAGFHVKNWTPTIPPSALPGIAGQGGVADPKSQFADHALVEWNGALYDPSYGTGPFPSLLAWQRASLDHVAFWENGIVGGQLHYESNAGALWTQFTTIQGYQP